MYDQPTTTEIDPSEAGFRIDPVLARSWLLVNGAQYGKFASAGRSRADIVVLDIEDAAKVKNNGLNHVRCPGYCGGRELASAVTLA